MLITRNVQKPVETISRRSSQCFCWRTFLIVDIIPRGRQSFAVGEIVGTAVRVLGSNGEKCLVIMLSMMHVRILTSFGVGDLGTEVDFLYTMMWVTRVTF